MDTTSQPEPTLRIRKEPDGRATRIDLMLGDKSVSRLWLTHFTLHVGEALVRMDGVGGVGTDEAYRNKGYSRRVLQAAVDQMVRGDAALSMLYGIRDFYPKFGYATAGPDHRVRLTDLDRDNALPVGWSVRPIRPDDLPAVQAIYARQAERIVGAARRDPDGSVWAKLRKVAEAPESAPVGDACRVVVGPGGGVHGCLWRARWAWYVCNVLESDYKRALVLGEVMADGPQAADAALAAGRQWAKEEPARRKVSEVVLALTPDAGPLASAAMRQDAKFIQEYSACGGAMARVADVRRLLKALAPELTARWRDTRLAFTGDLVLRTDIGDAVLRLSRRGLTVAATTSDPAASILALPQFELARLALGAFPAGEILARLPEPAAAPAAEIVQALFPARRPHMHLPDRY